MRRAKPLAWLAAAALLAVAAHPHRAVAQAKTLNLFTWSEYIDPKLVTAFEQQCGCKVLETDYESNAEMAAKMTAGGYQQYDVVVPSSFEIQELAAEKLIQPLDLAKIPNIKNLMPRFANAGYDPGNKYSVPYQWGTTGLVYDTTKIKNPPQSWGLLLDPKDNPNYPFVIPKGEGYDQIAAACAMLGYGFDCSKPSQWIAAAKVIIANKKRPNFAGFVEETPARDQMKVGQIAVSMAYNGDIGQCKANGDCKTMVYFIPKEGGEIWVDTMAIPSQAPHPELALKFINFILDAKNGAQLSNWNQYASPNGASQPMLQPILKTEMFTPTPADMKRLYFTRPLSGKDYKLFNSIWTTVLQ